MLEALVEGVLGELLGISTVVSVIVWLVFD